MPSLRRSLLVLAILLLAVAASGPDPQAQSEQDLAPAVTLTMPVADVRPGMQATVRTVFEGGRVEELGAEIVGVMDNFLGPGQDLILARLKGERVEFTGVAGGMSGSPVYVGDRLVGALSYRMGTFLKEPIAGITPIEYMLGVSTDAEAPEGSIPLPSPVIPATSEASLGLQPIETPVMVAGVPAAALEIYSADLARLGLGVITPGAAAASGSRSGDPPAGAITLRPGDPVAAQLVTGDISFAATGTVTLVQGDRVYAFGHPVFLNGATELPMARAEIYLTLSSLQASSKMSRVLDTVGTIRQSRLPAITGIIGAKPRMIPVTVRMQGQGTGGAAKRSFQYEVVQHQEFTPPLVGLVTAASLINTPWFADQMTVTLSGKIGLEGHPDVVLNDLYTGLSAAQPAAATMARDLQGLLGAVFQNRWEQTRVRSVDLDVSAVERSNLSFVEGVYPTRSELEPGERVELRVLIRPYRGEAYTRKFTYRVPEGAPKGPLAVYVGGANLLGAAERTVLARQVAQAADLDQLISLINRLRASNKLYLKIMRRHSGAVVLNEIMPGLPPSVLSTLGANKGTGEVTPLAETTIHEDEIVLDQILVGGTVVPLTIR